MSAHGKYLIILPFVFSSISAWYFDALIVERAPKKGGGIHIVIIDTPCAKTTKKNHADYTIEFIQCYAPEASITVIPAFNENGFTTQQQLLVAVKKAISYNPQILHLGLKLEHNVAVSYQKKFSRYLKKIPFVIAAAGNDGQLIERTQPMLSYPASDTNVTLTVGAFGYENNEPFIPFFSQYSATGPLLVAPGIDLKTKNGEIVHGTSFAAALITGFLALILSEFNNELTKKELLNIIFAHSFPLRTTADWYKKSHYGALDMQATLSALNALRTLKKKET